MKIAVSACLLGENCKYNGGNNYSEKVSQFVEGHELILVCPEVLGGLPTPRESAEIVNGGWYFFITECIIVKETKTSAFSAGVFLYIRNEWGWFYGSI
jgi:uncharacterized protein YbbK (DUF523 family)